MDPIIKHFKRRTKQHKVGNWSLKQKKFLASVRLYADDIRVLRICGNTTANNEKRNYTLRERNECEYN